MAVKMGAFDDVAMEREKEEKFFVSVRLRPLNHKEIATNDVSGWECINDKTIICKNENFFVPDRYLRPTAYKFGMRKFLAVSWLFTFKFVHHNGY